jgi:acyl-coenzyme A synthetase/AMP-(fatty) acid ligase
MDIDPAWIATPHIRPDHRGPADRPYVPFADPARAVPILEMLRAVALRHPDRVAVADAEGALTFAELLGASQRLAVQIEATDPAGHCVAVVLPTSVAYAVAVFGCLASGRLCVLLDRQFPPARNAALIAQTGASLALTVVEEALSASWPGARALGVDAHAKVARAVSESFDRAGRSPDPDAPAFLLCTSGSSGEPKAIVHSQRTMLHWARSTHEALHVGPDDCVMSLSSLSSLGGFTGLLNYGLAGASVEMIDVKASGLGGLMTTLAARAVTILRAAPSTLRGLARLPGAHDAFAKLRVVQTYGEPLMKADVAALRQALPAACHVRSTYGSTEASGLSWFAGEPDDHDPLRVASGVLMPDTVAAIVDEAGCSCACGEAGELWIRSRYNALGEWVGGRLTAGRLQPHPSGDGTRVFKTGDIARCSEDGVFVVLGRADRMVKINGQRIEPAEIEAVLRRLPSVERAEVVVMTSESPVRLAAFVVPNAAAPADLVTVLRSELRSSLPAFMMPARIVAVPSIPLLPGGKVDTLALQALAALPAAGEP